MNLGSQSNKQRQWCWLVWFFLKMLESRKGRRPARPSPKNNIPVENDHQFGKPSSNEDVGEPLLRTSLSPPGQSSVAWWWRPLQGDGIVFGDPLDVGFSCSSRTIKSSKTSSKVEDGMLLKSSDLLPRDREKKGRSS